MHSFVGVSLIAVVAIISACSDPTAVTPDVDLSVVRQTASAQDPNTILIEFAVTNTGRTTLYLPRCGEKIVTEVERLQGGEWSNAVAGICPAINRMDPIPIERGMQITGEQRVSGTGRFRLRTGAASEPGQEVGWNVFSGAFDIH